MRSYSWSVERSSVCKEKKIEKKEIGFVSDLFMALK